MRKFPIAVALLLFGFSPLSAVVEPQCPALDFEIGTGYRQGCMRWSISGPEGSPNVFVTNNWKQLRMYGVEGAARYVSVHHYVLQVGGNCGKIYHGHNRESVYLLDGKTAEAARIISKSNIGHAYDLNAAIGYQVMSVGRRTLFTVLAGYSHDQQDLHLTDGKLVENGLTGQLGPIPYQNSTYNARWFGPWLGIDMSTRVECNASLYASVAYHIPQFRADGRWKLRDQFLDKIEQKASAWGYDASLGFSWDFAERWGLGILAKYRHFHTHSGSNRATVQTGPQLVKVHSKLNSVSWALMSFSLSLWGRF